MIRNTVVALSLAALSVAGTASAQENATFTLRSGERLSGQLMDLSGVGYTVKIDGQERRISPNDLAVIDFTGGGTSQSDWDRLSNGQFAVLRDGQIVTGQLTDVGGSSPLRLSFDVNGANRDFQSNQVAKIVLARPNDAGNATTLPATSGTAGSAQGLIVTGAAGMDTDRNHGQPWREADHQCERPDQVTRPPTKQPQRPTARTRRARTIRCQT